jgi:hypothetical protein
MINIRCILMTVLLSVSILSAKEAFPQDTKEQIEYVKRCWSKEP